MTRALLNSRLPLVWTIVASELYSRLHGIVRFDFSVGAALVKLLNKNTSLWDGAAEKEGCLVEEAQDLRDLVYSM